MILNRCRFGCRQVHRAVIGKLEDGHHMVRQAVVEFIFKLAEVCFEDSVTRVRGWEVEGDPRPRSIG